MSESFNIRETAKSSFRQILTASSANERKERARTYCDRSERIKSIMKSVISVNRQQGEEPSQQDALSATPSTTLTEACPFLSVHPCTSSDDPAPVPLKKRPCLLASSTLPSQRTMIALLLKLHSLV